MKRTILLLGLLLLLNSSIQMGIASIGDQPSNRPIVSKDELVNHEFLVFNGSAYHERIVDYNRTMTEGIGENWTAYAEKYYWIGVYFTFDLVNGSDPFEYGDFVLVKFKNESKPIKTNATEYVEMYNETVGLVLENDTVIGIIPEPTETSNQSITFPFTTGIGSYPWSDDPINGTETDDPNLGKYVFYYTGNGFMNISAKTYAYVETPVLAGDIEGEPTNFGWTWLVMLAALTLAKRTKRIRIK